MKKTNEDVRRSYLCIKRAEKFIRERIKFYNLDLKDLVIYTEVGSNNYTFTPIIAALANAKKIYAIGKTSGFGGFEDIKSYLNLIISIVDINSEKINVVNEKKIEHLQEADIVTNSGFVRPIDRFTLENMKSTAVIPLMWETWEFRKDEIDIDYARTKGILILGTDESYPGMNIFNYRGFLVSKLFFECGMGLHKDKILLIGSGRLGSYLANFFFSNKIEFRWITFDKDIDKRLKKYLISQRELGSVLPILDAIVIAEHFYDVELIGRKGIVKIQNLAKDNSLIQIIHICGNVNLNDVTEFNISIHPKFTMPFGIMTVSGDYLGPKVTLELNIAGLKVGEIMARNRLKYGFKRTYLESIKHPLVDDFPGGYLNYGN